MKNEWRINKNYAKLIGLSLLTGCAVAKVYDLGISEGREQVGAELFNLCKKDVFERSKEDEQK